MSSRCARRPNWSPAAPTSPSRLGRARLERGAEEEALAAVAGHEGDFAAEGIAARIGSPGRARRRGLRRPRPRRARGGARRACWASWQRAEGEIAISCAGRSSASSARATRPTPAPASTAASWPPRSAEPPRDLISRPSAKGRGAAGSSRRNGEAGTRGARRDGRRLLAEVSGAEDGELIVFHHGTPGTRRIFEGQLRACAERGLRHVCYSRPGYEGSERDVGRNFADCASDVAAVVDALGVERFHVIGYSGGGPHALACAALLGERVLSTTTFGGVAPHDAAGIDWMEGAGQENLQEFAAQKAGEVELELFLREATPR